MRTSHDSGQVTNPVLRRLRRTEARRPLGRMGWLYASTLGTLISAPLVLFSLAIGEAVGPLVIYALCLPVALVISAIRMSSRKHSETGRIFFFGLLIGAFLGFVLLAALVESGVIQWLDLSFPNFIAPGDP